MTAIDAICHRDCGDGDPAGRITAAGYVWQAYGENVASGQRSPEAVMEAWMASPTHKANILTARFTHIGVAANEQRFWTQVFAQPKPGYVPRLVGPTAVPPTATPRPTSTRPPPPTRTPTPAARCVRSRYTAGSPGDEVADIAAEALPGEPAPLDVAAGSLRFRLHLPHVMRSCRL
jgi:uncharacterized protein YkwD